MNELNNSVSSMAKDLLEAVESMKELHQDNADCNRVLSYLHDLIKNNYIQREYHLLELMYYQGANHAMKNLIDQKESDEFHESPDFKEVYDKIMKK
jgi:septal ring factor EnvC (AmiA/AmiB activator)